MAGKFAKLDGVLAKMTIFLKIEKYTRPTMRHQKVYSSITIRLPIRGGPDFKYEAGIINSGIVR